MKEQVYAIEYLPTKAIKPSETNPRAIEDKSFNDLKKSIKEQGILLPIIVRLDGNEYEIIAGERRYRCAVQLDLKEIPCIVREADDQKAQEIQIIENLQREDIHPFDEAQCYKKLIDSGMEVKTLAAQIGKSNTYIYQRMVLVQLIEEVKELYLTGKLNTYQAMLFGRISETQQKQVCKHVQRKIEYQGAVDNQTIKDAIENQFTDLQNAPFALNDAALYPEAGACSVCAKRTGYNTELFDDIEKHDVCTDAKCFRMKAEKYVLETLQSFHKKNMAAVLVKDEFYNDAMKGALEPHEYAKVDSNNADAIIGIIAGGENIGQIMHVKVKQKEESEENPVKENDAKIDFEELHYIMNHVNCQLLLHVGKKLYSLKLDSGILREIAIEHSNGISDLYEQLSSANIGITKFGKNTESLLANPKTPFEKLILISRFIHDMRWDFYGRFDKEAITKWSKRLGVDLKPIIKKEKIKAKKEYIQQERK